MLTLGQRLKELRHEHHLSYEKLAELIGCHPTAIHYWEEDKRIPGTDWLIRLSRLYNVTLDFLATGKESKGGLNHEEKS